MEPWEEFLHATEVLIDLDYTADTPGQLEYIAMRYDTSDVSQSGDLRRAVASTARAVSRAVVLSQMDGPLPVMDIIAFSWAAAETVHAWYDYFA